MKRQKLEVQSADSSSPNTDNFRLMVVSSCSESCIYSTSVTAMHLSASPPSSHPLLSPLQADSACERVFTVNDVSHGGCKYGIMNFSGHRNGSLSVEMCDNLYFTNRKVTYCP